MTRRRCKIETIDSICMPDYSSQYFKSYTVRLSCMNDILEKLVRDKFGKDANIKKLADLEPNEKSIVIGIIYKKMLNRPNIIKEFSESDELEMPEEVSNVWVSSEDQLFLEENQQRISLEGINPGEYVTGISAAVIGYQTEGAATKFIIEDIIFPTPSISSHVNTIADRRYIAIVSGLRIGGPHTDETAVKFKLFLDWLTGLLPAKIDGVEPNSVARLIVAGDSIDCDDDRDGVSDVGDNLSLLDNLLAAASRSVPIDMMPGRTDPVTTMIPQPPLHSCLLPSAYRYQNFEMRPNPWLFRDDTGSIIAGSSGQNIDDIGRCAPLLVDPLDRLRASIRWGHLAPTAPDSLPSQPNGGSADPLMLTELPNLFFVGNQDQYSWVADTNPTGVQSLLVTVPRFCETGLVVMVDLMSKCCHSVSFQ